MTTEHVKKVTCSKSGHLVTLTIDCASSQSARHIFDHVNAAVKDNALPFDLPPLTVAPPPQPAPLQPSPAALLADKLRGGEWRLILGGEDAPNEPFQMLRSVVDKRVAKFVERWPAGGVTERFFFGPVDIDARFDTLVELAEAMIAADAVSS